MVSIWFPYYTSLLYHYAVMSEYQTIYHYAVMSLCRYVGISNHAAMSLCKTVSVLPMSPWQTITLFVTMSLSKNRSLSPCHYGTIRHYVTK